MPRCATPANSAILARRAAEHPGARATSDFQDILRSDLDLIEILTPHPQHEAMTVAALAGSTHVSVQKPMAMTLAECDRMIEAAATSGRRLKVFENFVFYPPLVRARELLREGAIGRPLHFRMKVVMADRAQAWHVPNAASRWRHALAAEGRGGPIVFDHGHHMMAVALWLFGEVRDGFACIERTETAAGVYDAPATLMWRHANPPVHGTWDVSLALKEVGLPDRLLCRRRAVRNSGRGRDNPGHAMLRPDAGRTRAHPLSGTAKSAPSANLNTDWGADFTLSTRHFLDVLAEAEEALTAQQGRRVIALYDLFQRSNAERRALAG